MFAGKSRQNAQDRFSKDLAKSRPTFKKNLLVASLIFATFVVIDLGIVDIFISDYGKKIRFMGEGEKTVVGKSIAGTTKGMSIPGMGRMVVKNRVKKRSNGKDRKKESTVLV